MGLLLGIYKWGEIFMSLEQLKNKFHDLTAKPSPKVSEFTHAWPLCPHFRLNGLYMKRARTWTGKRLNNYFKYRMGEKRKPQSGACHLELEGLAVELRFSTIGDVHLQEPLVIRVIQSQAYQGGFFADLFPKDLDILRRLTDASRVSSCLGSSGLQDDHHLSPVERATDERARKRN